MIEGGKGLEAALAAMWPDTAVQGCDPHTLQRHQNCRHSEIPVTVSQKTQWLTTDLTINPHVLYK